MTTSARMAPQALDQREKVFSARIQLGRPSVVPRFLTRQQPLQPRSGPSPTALPPRMPLPAPNTAYHNAWDCSDTPQPWPTCGPWHPTPRPPWPLTSGTSPTPAPSRTLREPPPPPRRPTSHHDLEKPQRNTLSINQVLQRSLEAKGEKPLLTAHSKQSTHTRTNWPGRRRHNRSTRTHCATWPRRSWRT